MKAPNFRTFDYAAIQELRVHPPLEPKDKAVAWARGSIRDKDFNELVLTGPRLPVIFSGCRFNNVVFAIRGPGEDEASFAFENFLHKVLSHVEEVVCANVETFKPGLKNAALLQFDRDFIRPSAYSADQPNELRVKLSVKRDQVDEQGQIVDVIDTVFIDPEGARVDPEDIASGSEIVPIMRVSYYRNSNKFGLNLTLLKGLVYPSTKKRRSVDYAELEFDV